MKLNIKQLRLKKGLTQTELAQLCDMSTENLQKIEQGRSRMIKYEHIDLLCSVLGCCVQELIIVEPISS